MTEPYNPLYLELAKQGIVALLLGAVAFTLGLAVLLLWRRLNSLTELFLQREREHSSALLIRETQHSKELCDMERQNGRELLRQQENHMLQQHATVQQVMRSFFSVSLSTDEDLES